MIKSGWQWEVWGSFILTFLSNKGTAAFRNKLGKTRRSSNWLNWGIFHNVCPVNTYQVANCGGVSKASIQVTDYENVGLKKRIQTYSTLECEDTRRLYCLSNLSTATPPKKTKMVSNTLLQGKGWVTGTFWEQRSKLFRRRSFWKEHRSTTMMQCEGRSARRIGTRKI